MKEAKTASNKDLLTVGEIARLVNAPEWAVRRLVDQIGEGVRRAGLYRLVPRRLLPRLRRELANLGYLSTPAGELATAPA